MAIEITIPVIIGAALIDSINPCVFGVLIFLIAFMFSIYKKPNKMLLGGFIYTTVVYLTYLAIGIALIQIFTIKFSITIYWVVAGIAILAGLLEIKDYFWYGKGPTLQLLPGSSKRIDIYTEKIKKYNKKHPGSVYLLAIPLGIFITLVELPCTGAPYLAILALIGKGFYAQALPLLLLYNLVFILPLLVVIFIAYFGASSRKLEIWRKKNRELMRLIIGLFLIFLGYFMIKSIGTFT